MIDEKYNTLHAAARKGDINTFLTLIDNGCNIMQLDDEGVTPLFVALENGHDDWLDNSAIKKLLTKEVLNTPDKDGFTILARVFDQLRYKPPSSMRIDQSTLDQLINKPYLISIGKKLISLGAQIKPLDCNDNKVLAECYQILLKLDNTTHSALHTFINSKDFAENLDILKQCNALRNLYVIFGGQKLLQEFDFLEVFENGGFVDEAMGVLIRDLNSFIKQKYPYDKNLNEILDIFSNNFFYIDELAWQHEMACKMLEDGKILISETGADHHAIGLMLQKIDKETVLTIAERGAWGKDGETGKVSGIQTLRFPYDKEKIKRVLELASFVKLPINCAYDIFFTEIPKLVNAQFELQDGYGKDLLSRRFKVGICYFANPKLLLHDFFVNYLNNGEIKYKEFDLYLREQALQNYKTLVPEEKQNLKLISLCERIVNEKQILAEVQNAISNNNLIKLKEILTSETLNNDLNVLYYAIINADNKTAILDWLYSEFDLNCKDRNGKTLLRICVEKKNFTTFMQLLSKGASLNEIDNDGDTPLHTAIKILNFDWFLDARLIKYITPDLVKQKNKQGKSLIDLVDETSQFQVNDKLIKIITPEQKSSPNKFAFFTENNSNKQLLKQQLDQECCNEGHLMNYARQPYGMA